MISVHKTKNINNIVINNKLSMYIVQHLCSIFYNKIEYVQNSFYQKISLSQLCTTPLIIDITH